tara:strand:+ start:222 stop:446 length:225 start_codon:yes stop_codon:yes gene_type:complete
MQFFKIKVKTNSSKNMVNLIDDTTLTVSVTLSPEKGMANKKIISLLANFFKVKQNQIKIVRGLKANNKIIKINQ